MTDVHPMFAKSRNIGPYGGLTAPGGSEASRDANQEDIESGKISDMMVTALGHLRNAGPFGLTWAELGEKEGWHHGRVTSVLSNLHRKGIVTALRKADPERGRSSIYVLPEFTEGRDTRKYRGTKASKALAAVGPQADRIKELEQEVALWRTRAEQRPVQDGTVLNEEVERLKGELAESRRLHAEAERGVESLLYAEREAMETLAAAVDFPKVEGQTYNFGNVTLTDLASDVAGLVGNLRTHLADEQAAMAAQRDIDRDLTGDLRAAEERIRALSELNETLKDRVSSQTSQIPTVSAEEAAFISKVKQAISGKPDTAVQPTRAGSLRALVAIADRLPRT